jgi:hypothetical protein
MLLNAKYCLVARKICGISDVKQQHIATDDCAFFIKMVIVLATVILG